MTIEIVVPEFGESVVEATVVRWLKHEGDVVNAGEAVVELETEKVNLEVSTEQSGMLIEIKHQEGDDVEIGDVLGLVKPSEDGGGPSSEDKAGSIKQDEQETDGRESTEVQTEVTEPKPERATPMAQRLVKEHGVDLADIPASGSAGRITKEDVEQYLQSAEEEKGEAEGKPEKETEKAGKTQPSAPKPQKSGSDRSQREERVRMSRRRQTIARRLVEAQQNAAMLTTFNEIDMSAVMALRQRRRGSFQEQHGVKLGFMSFFVKAVVGALKQFPHLNAEIDGDELVLKHYFDIGMAIGAEEGLVVPVIRDADRLTFAEIEQAILAYVEKVNEGTLSLDDLRGGSFSITNGGVFGSLLSTPILNPPQVGILGLHKIEKRPVVEDDEVVTRPMMYVALTYDHRVVDGREAVQFLVQVKQLIEDPEVLLLEG